MEPFHIQPRKRSSRHQFWHVLNDGSVDPPGHWLFCAEYFLWKPENTTINPKRRAIYGTRPWYTFGEGATREPEGHYLSSAFQQITYTPEDIRYTTSGNSIYAIFLGKPAAGTEVLMEAFSSVKTGKPVEVKKVSIPGNGWALEWSLTDAGLSVHIPDSGLNDLATVLKIETGS